MNYWRATALRALAALDGKPVDAAALAAEATALRSAVEKLEKPLSTELHASRKFFSGGTREEAEAKNRREAARLRALLEEVE